MRRRMEQPNKPQTLVKGLIINREKNRLYLISMCGVLTPSSSPVSFSRNFPLAFKVKCQVNARHTGREVQGVAGVGRCGRRFFGRWREGAAVRSCSCRNRNPLKLERTGLLMFLSELLPWLFARSSPVEPLLRNHSLMSARCLSLEGSSSLDSSSHAADCRKQRRREAQGQARRGFSSFPAGPLA